MVQLAVFGRNEYRAGGKCCNGLVHGVGLQPNTTGTPWTITHPQTTNTVPTFAVSELTAAPAWFSDVMTAHCHPTPPLATTAGRQRISVVRCLYPGIVLAACPGEGNGILPLSLPGEPLFSMDDVGLGRYAVRHILRTISASRYHKPPVFVANFILCKMAFATLFFSLEKHRMACRAHSDCPIDKLVVWRTYMVPRKFPTKAQPDGGATYARRTGWHVRL